MRPSLLMALALATTLATAARAATKTSETLNPTTELFDSAVGLAGSRAMATILIFIVMPALGFGLKWLFEQWTAKNTKRRDFIAKTTDKVVDLAWNHYWKLANTTGTLGGLLTNHLRLVDSHLVVRFQNPRDMRQRLDEIASTTAAASFPSFVRLLSAFEAFQFRGSNTYLLPHHAAGLALQRLYNQFVGSLGQDLYLSMSEIRLAVERKTVQKTDHGLEAPPDLGSAQFERETWFTVSLEDWYSREQEDPPRGPADLRTIDLNDFLRQGRHRYLHWLTHQPAAVAKAADALTAFSQLLSYELADLHAVWHRDGGPLAKREAWRQSQMAVIHNRWAGSLDASTVETLRRVRTNSPYFAPLGVGPSQRDKASSDQAQAAGQAGNHHKPIDSFLG